MTEMLRLSTEVHDKIIRQAVPDVTDEEVDEIIHNYPTANPFYYPEWWDERRSMVMNGENNIDLDYERLVMRAINSSDLIRLVVLETLALFGDDDDEDLIDHKVSECIGSHRRLVVKTNDSEVSDSEEEDIGDNWRREN